MLSPMPKISVWKLVISSLLRNRGFCTGQLLGREILRRPLQEQEEGIFEVKLVGSESLLLVTSARLSEEVCDEKRFVKSTIPEIFKIREIAGDGLFTARNEEPNWKSARNVLNPAFNRGAMQTYFPTMFAIAQELIQECKRQMDKEVDVTKMFTKATLSMIGQVGFGYSFGKLSEKKPHPFVQAMNYSLSYIYYYVVLPLFFKFLMFLFKNIKYKRSITFMYNIVDQVLQYRKGLLLDKNSEKKEFTDILDRMLTTPDSETGKYLSEENVRYQIITFLVAGHETTSGALSFTFYLLAKHPEVLKKVQQEISDVLGDDPKQEPSYEQILSLKYIQQVLKESLRLYPTAPIIFRTPIEDTTIGNQYKVLKGKIVMLPLPILHRDKKIWGPNPEKFDPDRFSLENKSSIPAHAYRPFGTGPRSCIGQSFTITEATLLIALILRQFTISVSSDYELSINETLTIKPKKFFPKVPFTQLRVCFSTDGAAQVGAVELS